MEAKRSKEASLLLWSVMAALLSQNLVVPVMSAANVDNQKNYYSPDPNAQTPPPVSFSPPPHGSGGGHATPTPSHGTPSHGGGSYGGTPPGNCINPPSGGHHHTTPSPPQGGGGGGYHSPPTPIVVSPPSGGYYDPPPASTPTPIVPSPPTGGYYNPPSTPTPITPITPTPIVPSPPTPTTPIDPGTPSTPGIGIPSPPFAFNPSSPPFTCIFWRNHPTLIWGLLGWWGTVGNVFGVTSLPGFGANMNLLQALSNTRTDGFGELYREGTAALLNSMAHARFPYTTNQVRDSFIAALGSNRAAGAQAHLFKLANEGRTKPRA
ncbi:hypothetical protein CDL12_26852 [Handroanthus impetiginosus]|uniref:Protodermal factor 1 n=1 Tax=Handroanthus impetiginosus TaxID=429701 RepID=A0A2G9G5Q9_9LAMI|nr:hypothetical protein CDL12_26852 [Handroanthus impetiginosus]